MGTEGNKASKILQCLNDLQYYIFAMNSNQPSGRKEYSSFLLENEWIVNDNIVPETKMTCCINLTKSNEEENIHYCTDCNVHQIKTIETNIFDGNHCQEQFNLSSSFEKHVTMHIKKPDTYVCNYCQKKIKNSFNFEKHIAMHTEEPKLVCNYCQKKFVLASSLKSHMWKHIDKKYFCNICGNKFWTEKALMDHLRKHHAGTLPYVCNYCEKKFANFKLLKDHIRIHIGSFSYTCGFCQKNFILKSNLLKHLRSIHET